MQEKLITMLTTISEDITGVKTSMDKMETGLREDITRVEEGLRRDIIRVEHEVTMNRVLFDGYQLVNERTKRIEQKMDNLSEVVDTHSIQLDAITKQGGKACLD